MRRGHVGEVEARVGFCEGFGEGAGFGVEEGGGLGEAVEHEDFEGWRDRMACWVWVWGWHGVEGSGLLGWWGVDGGD